MENALILVVIFMISSLDGWWRRFDE